MAKQLVITGPELTLNQIKALVNAISEKKNCKMQAVKLGEVITSANVVPGKLTAEVVDNEA